MPDESVINRWKVKLDEALARGYAGMRVHGNEAWLTAKDWKNFLAYEEQVNETLANPRMIALCTYPLEARRAGEIFDVAHAHQVAIAKRHGHWEMLETPEVKQTKIELAELTEALERRVHQRTSELATVNQQLQESQRKAFRLPITVWRAEPMRLPVGEAKQPRATLPRVQRVACSPKIRSTVWPALSASIPEEACYEH
jgi:hypothetical protein